MNAGLRKPFRCFLTGTFALAIVITLLGCGKNLAEKRQVAQELAVAITTDVDNWYLAQFPEGDARFVWSQVYETLVRLDPDLETMPGLATSWEYADEGRTWTFHLRKDVRFHDGSPLNAEAVVFSYSPQSYAANTILRPLERIEAVDEYTVRFVLSRPVPLPHYLTHIGWPVMAPSCVDTAGEFIKPVGTGPFRFQSQEKDQQVTLVRNEDYWGPCPQVARITFQVIPDAAARVIALEAGDVDLIVKVTEAEVARLETKAGIAVYRKMSTFTDFIQFNCQKAPFSDLKLRQAVAAAVDTESLAATVFEGTGQPAHGRPYSPIMLYADPDLILPTYDPAQARTLLAEAGWRDTAGDGILEKGGEPLRPTLIVTTNPNVAAGGRFVPVAEAIQGQLQQLGMDLKIQLLESGAFLKTEREGNFDMLLRTGFYVWGNYPRHFFIHHSNNLYSHIRDAELDKLITQADSIVDPQDQAELYHRLQQMTVDLLPAFYLVHQEKIVAARATVGGYEISAEAPWLNLRSVYIKAPR